MNWQLPVQTGPKLNIAAPISVEAGRQLWDLIHPTKEIKDFNVIGLESVPSEDFEIGFGCVYEDEPSTYTRAEMTTKNHTEHELWLYHEMALSEKEREEEQMDYLRSKGIY